MRAVSTIVASSPQALGKPSEKGIPMRKKIIVAVLCALAVYLCCCGAYWCSATPRVNVVEVGESGKFILTVTSTGWSGWTGKTWADGRYVFDTELGKKYNLSDDGYLGLSFTIKSIDDDGITIETGQAMSPVSENGGISPLSDQRQFEITLDDPCELATATMDEGMHYTFVLRRR